MSLSDRVPISSVVLTYNEQANLAPCMESLVGWASELFVVDSGSTDGTRHIAERYGAHVIEHPFETHARQWQWALTHVPFQHAWILALDADQRLTSELKQEIDALFRGEADRLRGIDGIYLNRRQIFRGRWIRHGGYYPKYLLKLFRRDRVHVDERELIDHHFYVSGRTRTLRHDLIEENVKECDIGFWIEKHNRYAALQARVDAFGPSDRAVAPRMFGTPDERTAGLKLAWDRLPLYLRPFLYFCYRYVVRLGFLDGKQGFVFHVLQAFWYRLLIDIHLDDLRRQRRSALVIEASKARNK